MLVIMLCCPGEGATSRKKKSAKNSRVADSSTESSDHGSDSDTGSDSVHAAALASRLAMLATA